MSRLPISFDDIARAHERIGEVAHRTPVFTSATANHLTGAQIFFKCENFQRTGAFKFRGAYNALSQFTPEQRAHGVVAFSGGNHAQGIALSARLLEMNAVIVMPADAPATKVAATHAYGAEVLLYDRYTEDREAIGLQLAEKRGLTLIPSYDHLHVMAGQGTAAKELIEEVGLLGKRGTKQIPNVRQRSANFLFAPRRVFAIFPCPRPHFRISRLFRGDF